MKVVSAAVRVLLMIVEDVGCAVVADVSRSDVELSVQEGAEFAELVEDDEDRGCGVFRF